MSAAGPLPLREIMSNGPVSNSPKRPGRSRLSEILKPSPPVSRSASPGQAQPVSNSHGPTGNKAGDVASWPLVTSAQGDIHDSRANLTYKSKDNGIEVVVGTSPMKQSDSPTHPPAAGNGIQRVGPRLSRAVPSFSMPMPPRLGASVTPPDEEAKDVERAGAPRESGLQRSASDLNLPDIRARADTASSTNSRPSIRSAVSEIGLATMASGGDLPRPQAVVVTKDTKVSRRQSITNRLRSRSKPQPLHFKASDSGPDLAELPKAMLSPRDQIANPLESVGKPARRTTWIIGSRSPSPSNRKLLAHKKSSDSRPGSSLRNKTFMDDPITLQKSKSKVNVNGGATTPKSKRPLSAIIRSSSFVGGSKPNLQLPKSMSSEHLPISSPIDEVPEMPKSIPRSRLQTSGTETPKRKDEMYTIFRQLDAEHQKFISKASSLRAQVVRAGLLPFLKNNSDHSSTKMLRAEDLDRRVNILNKWWTSLLEMLNGRNGHSVSPNDRPAVLEAVSGIMTRPEWRLSLSTITSRTPGRLPVSRSVSSLESSASDFLAESVLHNVRNIFVQNLLSQMAFVVERMSARTVPASIVTFCGKACAYAFFFCPGIAEILVRLWSPTPDAIKRVLKEAGAMDRDYDPSFALDVLSRNFPAHLQPLTVASYASLIKYLRNRPKDNLSLNSAYIPWNGPWVGRWCGRDSDLFFVFVKTAVALICELLPDTTSTADWISVPCAALIQSQILVVMDATIHRGSSSDPMDGLPPPSFDDLLGVDAVVHPLPVRAPNTTRIMAENRLIMLLRECLFSSSFPVKPSVRRTFAELYANIIKASTRRVSIFDHNAYFTFCDFLDEAFGILARFHKDSDDAGDWLDWTFWFDALKKMGNTHNTMSEVRLYAFIYSLWTILAQTEARKNDLCINWLLRKEYFEQQFNHWCPMVRAYYMRLLLWRVAREDGDANKANVLIFETLYERMNSSWSWFLALQASARENDTVALSTAPSVPAPGRKLLIVRSDGGSASAKQMSWDNMMAAASSSASPNSYQRYTSLNHVTQAPTTRAAASSAGTSSPKKSWLRKINPFASSSPPGLRAADDSDNDSIISIHEDSKSTESSNDKSKRMSTISVTSIPGQQNARGAPTHSIRPTATAAFKFSLEWIDKASLVAKDRQVHPPQLPQLAQQLVDAKAASLEQHEEAVKPAKPRGDQVGPSKYCGRALAEWEILVRECQSFYDRRRQEGISDVRWMEIPTLSVENFRRPLG